MVTKSSVARPARTRQAWTDAVVDWRGRTVEAPEVIGAAWSDIGADFESYRTRRTPATATTTAPPSQENDDQPDPPAIHTPKIYNGYIHPGPAPKEFKLDAGETWAQRAERESRERYDALDCKCAVCVLKGPKYCPGNSEPLKPLTTEQARVARKALILEGQRQKEQREQRQKLIAEQITKATAAGHDVKRIERAAALVNDRDALEAVAAKYSTTTADCHCPDKKHGPASRKCKHQLAAIIAHNVDRQLAGEQAEEIEAIPAGAHIGDSPYKRMLAKRARAQAQASIDAERIPVHTPELERDAAGMLWS